MSDFKLAICCERPIVKIGQKFYLIDTLGHTMVGDSVVVDNVDWAGACGVLHDNNKVCARLSQSIGVHLDGVLGSDFLCNFHTVIDYSAGSVGMSRCVRNFEGWRACDIDATLAPVVDMTILGKRLKILLSTGFGISYVRGVNRGSDDLVLRGYCDGAPLGFSHITEVFRVAAFFGPSRVVLRIGRDLPPCVNDILDGFHVDGVVGYDFFSRFKVSLDALNTSFMVCESK